MAEIYWSDWSDRYIGVEPGVTLSHSSTGTSECVMAFKCPCSIGRSGYFVYGDVDYEHIVHMLKSLEKEHAGHPYVITEYPNRLENPDASTK